MTVWRAEVKFSDVTIVGAVGADQFNTTNAFIYFQAEDDITQYNLSLGIQFNSYGGGPTTEWQAVMNALYDGSDVWDGTTMDTIEEADGANGAGFTTGGMLAIEKDTVGETVSWISPLGTITKTFADLAAVGPTPDSSPLRVEGMGHQFGRLGGTDPESESVRWHDMWSIVEDEVWHGADLTADDPGDWTAWFHDPVFSSGALEMVDGDTQLTNGYQSKYQWTAADDPRNTRDRENRFLQGSITDHAVDLTRADERPLIFAALVLLYQQHRMRYRRSYDGGRNWETGVVYEEVGEVMSRPSITWWNGRLVVLFARDMDILQATSFNAALEWEMPITLPYTGTFPRHIVHPRMGVYLYFYFDGTTLKVARSSDFGHNFWDASPITITAGLSAQQIDAELAFDDSIIVTYFNGGAWEQKRSWDLGTTWS